MNHVQVGVGQLDQRGYFVFGFPVRPMAALTVLGSQPTRAATARERLPSDRAKVAAALEANHVGPAFAYYWVARPLVFLSAGKLKIAVYQGPGAFADLQQPAETSAPELDFSIEDPDGDRFAQFCAARRVTYRRLETTGVIVYADLSAPVSPKDFGVAWKS